MISVGKRLEEERLSKNLSLEKVSSATKINTKFLQGIEEGNYKNIPPGYAIGFVRNYAKYLGLPEKETIALFRREYDTEKELAVLPRGMSQDFNRGKFRLRRGLILFLFLFVLLGLFIVYQYKAAIFNPSVTITSPSENAKISSPTIDIIGKTEPDSTVLIENETASIDKMGNFRKQIILFPGAAIIKIKVTNRFGRQTEVLRHIDVKAGY